MRIIWTAIIVYRTNITYLPDDNATCFIAINKLSPSTKANDRFTQPTKTNATIKWVWPNQPTMISLVRVTISNNVTNLRCYSINKTMREILHPLSIILVNKGLNIDSIFNVSTFISF